MGPFPSVNMFPARSIDSFPCGSPMNSEHFGDGLNFNAACSKPTHLGDFVLRKLRTIVPRAAGEAVHISENMHGVQNILGPCDVLQIFKRGVLSVSVFVIDFMLLRNRPNKGCHHQLMDESLLSRVIPLESNGRISFAVPRLKDFKGFASRTKRYKDGTQSYSKLCRDFGISHSLGSKFPDCFQFSKSYFLIRSDTSNTAHIANFVKRFVSENCFPMFFHAPIVTQDLYIKAVK